MVAWDTPATGRTQENLVSHTLPRTALLWGRPPLHFALGARRLVGGRDEEDPQAHLRTLLTEEATEAAHRSLNTRRLMRAPFRDLFAEFF